MNGEMIAFFVLALATLGGAILMINLTKVVHMVVALAVTFISIAGLFILLHAEFLAFVQVLVYGGAVSIVMLFGIMLTRHDAVDLSRRVGQKAIAFIVVALFLVVTFYVIMEVDWIPQTVALHEENTANIGIQLFSKYVIPFETVSVVLLVALVGAIILAKRDDEDQTENGGGNNG